MRFPYYFIFLLLIFCCLNINAILNDSTADNKLASNNNKTTVTDKVSENIIETYQKLLTRFTEYRLTKEEFEEIYGNKSAYGLVYLFAPWLIDETSKQIGFNEIRRCFHLKFQRYNLDGSTEEEPENESNVSEEFLKSLIYFQKLINKYTKTNAFMRGRFWQEDIDVAEKFLDKKLQEVRQLYKLNCKTLKITNNDTIDFNESAIDKMYKLFRKTRADIRDAAIDMVTESFGKILSLEY